MEYYAKDYKDRMELDNFIKTNGHSEVDFILGTAQELNDKNLDETKKVFGIKIIKI